MPLTQVGITTLAGNGTNSVLLAVPTGTLAGDWLYCVIVNGDVDTRSVTTIPAGWALVTDDDISSGGTPPQQTLVYQHLVVFGDPTSYEWLFDAPFSEWNAAMFAVRGASKTPLEVFFGQQNGAISGGAQIAPSAFPLRDDNLVYAIHTNSDLATGSSWTPPSGYTTQASMTTQSQAHLLISSRLQTTATLDTLIAGFTGTLTDGTGTVLVIQPLEIDNLGGITLVGLGAESIGVGTNATLPVPPLTVPLGVIAGDVLLLAVMSAAPALLLATPAGWTLHSSTPVTGSGMRYWLFWRIAIAVTPDPVLVFTGSGVFGSVTSAQIIAYRGVDTITPIIAVATLTPASSSSAAIPTLSTGSVTNAVIAHFIAPNPTTGTRLRIAATNHRSGNELTGTNTGFLKFYDELQLAAGSNVPRTVNVYDRTAGSSLTMNFGAMSIALQPTAIPSGDNVEWRVLHFNALGFAKTPSVYDTTSSPIASLESIDVDEYGNSLEASFTGLVSDLNVADFDTMQIQYRTSSITPWISLYAGEVRSPGVNKSFENSTIKLVGLHDRLYSVAPEGLLYGSSSALTDIGDVARQIVKDLIDSGRIGAQLVFDATLIPVIGATISTLTVQASSVGQLLDLLASSWTDVVWGVNADRKVFFKPKPVTSISITEGASDRVDFKPSSSDPIINVIDFFVPVPKIADLAKYTVRKASSVALYGERRKDANVPAEYDLVREVKGEYAYFAANPGGTNSAPSGAFVAVVPSADAIVLKDRRVVTSASGQILMSKTFTTGLDEMLLVLDEAVSGSGALDKVGLVLLQARALVLGTPTETARVTLDLRRTLQPSLKPVQRTEPLTLTSPGNIYDLPFSFYQVPRGASIVVGSIQIRFTVQQLSAGASSITMSLFTFEMRPYEFDSDVLDKIALTMFRDPAIDPASITSSSIRLPVPGVTLTTAAFGVLTRAAKLFRYVFTSGQYAETVIELEQAYSENQTARAEITNEKDRRVTGGASAFTLSASRTGSFNGDPGNPGIWHYTDSFADNTFSSAGFTAPAEWANQKLLFIIGGVILRTMSANLNALRLEQSGAGGSKLHTVKTYDNKGGGADATFSGSVLIEAFDASSPTLLLSFVSSAIGDIDPQSVTITVIAF